MPQSFQDRLSRALRRAGGRAHPIWQRIRALYAAPFQVDSANLLALTPAQFEQQRRIDFLRMLALSLLCVELVLAMISLHWLREVPRNIRMAEVAEMNLSAICLTLSYQPLKAIVGYLYGFGSFGVILFTAWSDQDGLNQRSVLIYSLVVLVIVTNGLILPPQVVWWTTLPMIVIAVASVMIEPIKVPVPSSIPHPHAFAAASLFYLYAYSAIVTQVYVRSTQVNMGMLARAYTGEHQLEEMAESFIDVAGHELRAPLTSILLTCRLIERRAAQPDRFAEMPKLVGELVSRVKRMDGLIDVLLDSTRARAGTFSIELAPSDVAAIVKEAAADQRMLSQREVLLSGVEQPVWSMVDQRRFWQVVANLIGNALRYSPKDSPVEVSLQPFTNGASYSAWLRLSVRDYGPGIPAEQATHLFERFYRGEISRPVGSQAAEGIGLGLYVCQAIVAAHGGALRVESAVGEGSTFIVEIPAIADESDRPLSREKSGTSPFPGAGKGAG